MSDIVENINERCERIKSFSKIGSVRHEIVIKIKCIPLHF